MQPDPHTDPVSTLLSHLEHVRQYGRGYRADCPCGHSSKGSLSVTAGDDGRVLMNCFVGCAAVEIVGALGLTIADLFPARITHNTTPQERTELRQRAKESQWRAALDVLAREADVVLIAARMVEKHGPLAAEDKARLWIAVDRITQAKAVLNVR